MKRSMLYLMNHTDTLDTAFSASSSDALPNEQLMRTAWEMAHDRGLSHREIAQELNVPLTTIKKALQAGVRQLRAAMMAAGGQGVWAVAA